MTGRVPEEVVERHLAREIEAARSFVPGDLEDTYKVFLRHMVIDQLAALTPADLRALVSAMMPGHVVVPVEPTQKMLDAGARSMAGLPAIEFDSDGMTPEKLDSIVEITNREDSSAGYRAMIEAAQASEAGDG